MKKDCIKSSLHAAVYLALAINIALMCWYIFWGYQSYFHSDSAAKVLLAREILESGEYFPTDWNYVNSDLFVIFGHTFIVPLLAAGLASYTAHAVSGLISASLILSGVWLISGLGKATKIRRLLVVAVFAAGISGFTAENLYGQVSYGSIIYMTAYIIYFAWRFDQPAENRRLLFGVALFVLLGCVFWANPQRALITYLLPLAFAFAWKKNQDYGAGVKDKRWMLLSALCFSSVLLGTLLHLHTISNVNNIRGASSATWLPYDLVLRNVGLTIEGLLALLGGLPAAGDPVVSKSGGYLAIRLFGALLTIFLIPIALARHLKEKGSGFSFMAAFCLVSIAATALLQIFTSLPDMSGPIQSSRYLLPSLALSLLLTLMLPINFQKFPLLGAAVVFIAVVFVSGAYPILMKSDPSSFYHFKVPTGHASSNGELAKFLQENNLKYGYAFYWNAGAVSVLSNEKALVRQIGIEHGLPMPMRHLGSNRWYRPSAWQGETFLLLTPQEADAINWERMATLQALPTQELAFGGYKIYVFKDNLAQHIPGWDTRYETPFTFSASAVSLTLIGHLVENDNNLGRALVAEQGQQGYLHFGPYINISPGKYTATFELHAAHNDAGVARLDIASAADQKILSEKTLTQSNGIQTLTFEIDQPRTIEFRVYALGNERVAFRGVTVKRLSDSMQQDNARTPQ